MLGLVHNGLLLVRGHERIGRALVKKERQLAMLHAYLVRDYFVD